MLEDFKDIGKYRTRIAVAVLLVAAVGLGGFTSLMNNQAGLSSGQSLQTAEAGSTGALSYDARDSAKVDQAASERKRIETYSLRYEAQDVRDAVSSTSQIAESYGGYITSENFENNGERGNSASVTVRVPSENVSNYMQDLEAESWDLESRNRNVEDVTERYTELELELENKRQELRRLEELMNSTNETDSLIKIQERMGELRSRIQYLETQLEDIDRRVDYTEIDMHFEEPEPITSEFELRGSFKDAYQAVFTMINWLIVGTGYLLPVGLLYGVYRLITGRLRE